MNWWSKFTDGGAVFTVPAVLLLLVFEIGYIVLGYDSASSRTQTGLMLIFALEMSFMAKIGNANLEEKRRMGRTSRSTRIFNAAVWVPLLALVALGLGLAGLQKYTPLWIALFVLGACGKIGWLKNHSRLFASQQF